MPREFRYRHTPVGIKPPGAMRVDTRHPVGKDLIWYFYGNDLRHIWTQSGDLSIAPSGSGHIIRGSRYGLGVVIPNLTDYLAFDNDRPVTTNIKRQGFSWFFDFYLISFNLVSNIIFGNAQASGADYNFATFARYVDGSSDDLRSFIKTDVSSYATSVPGTVLVDNTRYRVVCTYDGITLRQYVDGRPDTTVAATGNVNVTDLQMVFDRWSSGSQLQMQVFSAGVINRVLPPAEVAAFSTDMYQFLQPVVPLLASSATPPPPLNTSRISAMHFLRPWEPIAMGQ